MKFKLPKLPKLPKIPVTPWRSAHKDPSLLPPGGNEAAQQPLPQPQPAQPQNISTPQTVEQKDLKYLNDLNAAMHHEKHHGMFWMMWLIIAFVVVFIVWAYNSQLDEMTHGSGRVIPSSREQVIQSLDPGVLTEMLVKEGDIVTKGQPILRIDDTRSSALYREGKSRVESLKGAIARLRAEAYGEALSFPADLAPEIQKRERAAYDARLNAVYDGLVGLRQSKALLDREIGITAPMVAQGVMSEVELLRLKRQSNDLGIQISERRNKYRSDASTDLVRAEGELSQSQENLAARADPVNRATINAPLRGIIKNIRINTIGGVVSAGQDILEIVPLDDTLLVEIFVRPSEVAFLRLGLPATVKLTAYDYSLYGGLAGEVDFISPDTLRNDRQQQRSPGQPDDSQFRVLIRTHKSTLTDKNGKPLPIIPGMTAEVDMKTGNKTVLTYLTKPLRRVKQAMTER